MFTRTFQKNAKPGLLGEKCGKRQQHLLRLDALSLLPFIALNVKVQ